MMVERQVNPAARQSHREQAKRPAWRRHVAGTRDATRPVPCVQRLNALSGNAIDLAFAWDPKRRQTVDSLKRKFNGEGK